MGNYYLFNTNAQHLPAGNKGTDIYEKGVVATYGNKEEWGRLLDALVPGDVVISYVNGLGAKAFGSVTEEWNGETITDPKQKVDPEDHGEFHVGVNWQVVLDDESTVENDEILQILDYDPDKPLNATRHPIAESDRGDDLINEMAERAKRGGGQFGSSQIQPIPETIDFEIGARYSRWFLHEKYGGQPYTGISTPADDDVIFLFTGASGKDYGYEDHFKDDGTFVYTGEGRTGDMVFSRGNKAVREHRKNGERLLLFESTDLPWIVSFVGEYEYERHRIDTLPDENDEPRKAIRFELIPEGGREIAIEESSGNSTLEDFYERAKQSAPTESAGEKGGISTTTTKTYSRAEEVKKFALKAADGVCQGCDQDAPFIGKDGDPFLEVHHMRRRADGGADEPENVIALCPNCHRRVHAGESGDEFNQQLIEKAEQRNMEL